MKPTLFDLLDNQQMPDHARPDVSLGEVRETVDRAVAEYRKALAEACDLMARYLWHEDDSGDGADLVDAHDRLRALIEQDTPPVTIGPIEHSSSFCRVAASDGIGCRCWCLACEQHNAVDHGTLAREGATTNPVWAEQDTPPAPPLDECGHPESHHYWTCGICHHTPPYEAQP